MPSRAAPRGRDGVASWRTHRQIANPVSLILWEAQDETHLHIDNMTGQEGRGVTFLKSSVGIIGHSPNEVIKMV